MHHDSQTISVDVKTWFTKIGHQDLLFLCASGIEVILDFDSIVEPVDDAQLSNFIGLFSPVLKGFRIINCPQPLASAVIQGCTFKGGGLTLAFESLSWFSDKWLEAVAKKFQSSIVSLSLVSCNVTNNGLFQLSKRCRKIRTLSLINCAALTDVGLVEVLRNNSLQVIQIEHNKHFSDLSLETMAQNSPNLVRVELNNVPKFSNDGIASLSDTRKAVGNRRIHACQNVSRLRLSMLDNLTSDSFLWMCTSMRSLVDVELSSCSDLDFSGAFSELKHLTRLERLIVGPTTREFQTNETSLDDMADVLSRVSTIMLKGLRGLDDEHLGYLFDRTDGNLKEVILESLACGTNFVESICTTQPKLPTITIKGSGIISDKDLRCLTSVCIHLKALCIENCDKITEAAFTRLGNLRKLESFHFQAKTLNVTSDVMKYLVKAPLQSLELKGIIVTDFHGFLALQPSTIRRMRHISFEDSVLPSPSAFPLEVLDRFLVCESVVLTNCDFVNLAEYQTIVHHNPFLRFEFNSEFWGFKVRNDGAFDLHCKLRRVFERHSSARKIQRMVRLWVAFQKDLRSRRRKNWGDLKTLSVVKIQSLWRRHVVRTKFLATIASAKLVCSCVVAVAKKRLRQKIRFATAFRTKKLKSIVLLALKRCQHETRDADTILRRACEDIRWKHLLHKSFRDLLDRRELARELRYIDSALVVREIRLMMSVFNSWKSSLNSRQDFQLLHRAKLLTIFPLKYRNSLRQQKLNSMSVSFQERRLLLRCWNVFAEVHNEKKRANLLVPLAVEHFAKSFFARMMTKVFHAWAEYKAQKLAIHRRREEASKYFVKKQLQLSLRAMTRFARFRQLMKHRATVAGSFRNVFVAARALKSWAYVTQLSLHFKASSTKAMKFSRHWAMEQGLIDSYRGISSMRNWKRMNTKADLYCRSIVKKHSFAAWIVYKTYCANLDAYYFRRYLNKQKKKIVRILSVNLGMRQEAKRKLMDFVAANAASPEKCIRGIVVLQALVRKHRTQSRFHESRIQKLYAIQTVQNFIRTILARKEFAKRMKLQLLDETIREDKELDAMRDAEIETRFFLYQLDAIITIQRYYRGWRGRLVAFQRAVEHYRDKSAEFYKENQHMHQFHEMYLRAAIAREQLRHRSATLIQKVARGMICRKRYIGVKHQARVEKLAIVVQTAYRSRLAKLRLAALKRSIVNDQRFDAARKQRAKVLRTIGFRNRSAQNFISPILRSLGIDPITFNYRIGELVDETIQDFHNFWGIVRRERALVKEHGFNRLNLAMGRRKVLFTQGWKYNVQDAVKIVEPGHSFEGFTGTIVRIDETLLGIPLYEVKLDKFPRQTYVRMTADPLLAYLRFQPLAKITKNPVLQTTALAPADDDATSVPKTKSNNRAAVKIQNTFRAFRSKSIVARRRYEHWLQNIDRHRSFLTHFSETNTLSSHGNLVAKLLGLKAHKEVYFDEMRHKIQPGRLRATVAKKTEATVIAKEFDLKFKDRTKYLQKAALIQAKDFFPLGYERLTFGRKLMFAVRHGYGVFFKPGKSLQDASGSGSTRVVYRRESVVTGLDRYYFGQFSNSPHVRYQKSFLYQGEWTGVPLFTKLVPHGEGLIVFFDGWGFAREDKVLYLTVVRCRYLNAMDLTTSDPYCDITCNGINLQTSVKWENLNPEFHESFEIDVTNPAAELAVVVKDKDYFGSDDFMGQISIPLKDYSDGKEHTITMQLKGEDPRLEEDFDRGEIELRLRWAERLFEDDQKRLEVKNAMLIRIQCWARRITASNKLKRLRAEYVKNYHAIRICAVKITCVCRMRLSVKEFKRLSRNLK